MLEKRAPYALALMLGITSELAKSRDFAGGCISFGCRERVDEDGDHRNRGRDAGEECAVVKAGGVFREENVRHGVVRPKDSVAEGNCVLRTDASNGCEDSIVGNRKERITKGGLTDI